MIDLEKAFAGRWNYKGGDFEDCEVRQLSGKEIKKLCRDFFEAGYYLADGLPMSAIVKAAEEVAFDEWWELYNKKRGKEKCMAKWNKLSSEEKQACISATPAYVASTPNKVYRKDPLTYLNGKCWNDEIIYKDNGNKPDNDLTKLGKILAP